MTAPQPLNRRRVTVRAKGQITLPAEVRDALRITEGDEVEFAVQEDGSVRVQGLVVLPADQQWFWTRAWQSGEREASEQIAAGDVTTYPSEHAMFADLNSH